MDVKRTGIVLKPTNSRVVIRPFELPNETRVEKIIARVASLSEAEVERLLEEVMREFRERHQRTREFFLHRFEQVRKHLLTDQPLSESRRLLIGSYFTSGVRAGVGGPVQPVDGLAPRPVGPARRVAAGSSSACGPPARGTSRRSPSAPA